MIVIQLCIIYQIKKVKRETLKKHYFDYMKGRSFSNDKVADWIINNSKFRLGSTQSKQTALLLKYVHIVSVTSAKMG